MSSFAERRRGLGGTVELDGGGGAAWARPVQRGGAGAGAFVHDETDFSGSGGIVAASGCSVRVEDRCGASTACAEESSGDGKQPRGMGVDEGAGAEGVEGDCRAGGRGK